MFSFIPRVITKLRPIRTTIPLTRSASSSSTLPSYPNQNINYSLKDFLVAYEKRCDKKLDEITKSFKVEDVDNIFTTAENRFLLIGISTMAINYSRPWIQEELNENNKKEDK
ncbi:21801_t:CDS:2 [Rhizophagus irregularis]|nr:21801_t:CDS:2 [Rhizophagus irregularis]